MHTVQKVFHANIFWLIYINQRSAHALSRSCDVVCDWRTELYRSTAAERDSRTLHLLTPDSSKHSSILSICQLWEEAPDFSVVPGLYLVSISSQNNPAESAFQHFQRNGCRSCRTWPRPTVRNRISWEDYRINIFQLMIEFLKKCIRRLKKTISIFRANTFSAVNVLNVEINKLCNHDFSNVM